MTPDWPVFPNPQFPPPLRPYPHQEQFLREWFGMGEGRDEALTTDELLRCREQALHSAAIMFDTGGQFPEDEADRVVVLAKRFERFMRTGE
jgi:hypothetical protein